MWVSWTAHVRTLAGETMRHDDLDADDHRDGAPRRGPYMLHCEPEGAEHEVLPGDVLTLTFSAPTSHGFEIAYADGGLLLCRLGDSEVSIEDKRGRRLRW